MHTFCSQFQKPPDCIWRLLIDSTIERKKRSSLLAHHNDYSLVTGIRHWSVWLGDSYIQLCSFAALSSSLPWLLTIVYEFLLLWFNIRWLGHGLLLAWFAWWPCLRILGFIRHYWSLFTYSRPLHLLVHLEGDEEESRRRGRATFAEVLPPHPFTITAN